jgi:putative hydrolase of the HAD superfamily
MSVTALLFDLGGVVLTNGWDHSARQKAAEQFDLDFSEFEPRHEAVAEDFETGRLTLESYLEHVVFNVERPFTREEFKSFMFSLSHPLPESVALLDRLRAAGRRLFVLVNNESLELNLYRIRNCGVRERFDVFCSSCYLGARKPGETIYRKTLDLIQREPEECIFIDDRPENLIAPRKLGMACIQFQNAGQLERDLKAQGVQF